MARYRRRHNRETPRSWINLFVRLGGWIAVVTGVAMVVMTLFSVSALYLADRFDREGALAYAVVTGKRIEETTDSDGDVSQAFQVEFTFKVRGSAAGAGQVVEKAVPTPYFNRAVVGEEQPIRYLVSDPTRLEEDIGYYRGKGQVLRWTGLILGLAGLAVLWTVGARTNRAIRARRYGEKRYARVTAIRELKFKVAGARQGRLVWREEDGQTGESLMRRVDWLRERYRPGDPVVVYRLRRHAYWEGDVGPPSRKTSQG